MQRKAVECGGVKSDAMTTAIERESHGITRVFQVSDGYN